MNEAFDEAYARYLSSLAKLDTTSDIFEKNVLFKQLTEQLSELEERINDQGMAAQQDEASGEDSEVPYWL